MSAAPPPLGRRADLHPILIAFFVPQPHHRSGDARTRNREVGAWLAEMSARLKALCPRHLVSIGAEGFYSNSAEEDETDGNVSESTRRLWLNPAGALLVAIHFLTANAREGRGFLSAH